MSERLSGIYVILDAELMPHLIDVAEAALKAGVRLFQYRDKRGCKGEVLQALHARTQQSDALLFVNDEVALTPYADGVHIGQEDLSIHSLHEIRAAYPHAYIGVSAHTVEQARAAAAADYLGIGPLHPTVSKTVERPALTLAGVEAIAATSSLPICAIGGIQVTDIAALRASKIAMAAVIGAIAKAEDPFNAARVLVQAWQTHQRA